MKHEHLCRKIIELVGGRDNIESVTHCMTRLRFKLRARSLAKTDELKAMNDVIDVVSNDVAYQIIIGTHVSEIHPELLRLLDSGGGPNSDLPRELKKEKKTIRSILQGIMSSIAETINPFLEILMAVGMVSALLSILTLSGILSEKSNTYVIFSDIKESVFKFLPVLIAASFAIRRKVSPYLAMALAFTLVMPNIDGVNGLSLFGVSLSPVTYSGNFISALLGTWALCVVYENASKLLPQKTHFFLLPALTLMITLPVVLFLFGPAGNLLSMGLTGILQLAMNSVGPWLALTVYSILHPFIMITGAGAFMLPISLNLISTLGYDPATLPGGLIGDFSVTGAVFGYLFRARYDNKRSPSKAGEKEMQLFGATGFSALLGITEPALYGVFAKYRRPFIATIIGGGIGGLTAGILGVKTYGFVWGIASIPTYITGGVKNLVGIIIAISTAFVISAIVSYGLGIPRDKKQTNEAHDADSHALTEPLNGVNHTETATSSRKVALNRVSEGKVVSLQEANDNVFAMESLGKGIGIIPMEKITAVFSPVSGEIISIFPTKHAYCILSDDGIEVLIHIGIDTVQLNGRFFETLVSEGQRIQKGELLGHFDAIKIKEEGLDPIVIVVITNTSNFLDVIPAIDDKDELLHVVFA